MNITVLSDLNWESHLRSVTAIEVQKFKKSDLKLLRYASINKYYKIIEEEQSSLVLFAGDITGDGSCGHGFQYAFMILLKCLEEDQIHSSYIKGNHDEDSYYEMVNKFAHKLKYAKEATSNGIEILGLRLLGINYYETKSKTLLKKLLSKANQKYDIVLAHSQLKRRIRLFEIKSDFIFTGHYDRKLFYHQNSCYVSLDNDMMEISYATINISENQSKNIAIKIKESDEFLISLHEKINDLKIGKRNEKISINNTPTIEISPIEKSNIENLTRGNRDYSYLKFIRGIDYKKVLEAMHKLKVNQELDSKDLKIYEILHLQIINNYRISESMIEDYLGNVIL